MIGNYSRCLIAEAKPAKLWLLTDGYMILPFQQQASAGPRESPGLKIWSRPPYWSGGWRMLNVCVRVKSLFRSIQIQTTSAWTSSYEVRFTCNCSLLPNCICCPSTTSIYILCPHCLNFTVFCWSPPFRWWNTMKYPFLIGVSPAFLAISG